MMRLWIMPTLFVVLLLLPIKMAPKRLMTLAFFLWLSGGLMLTCLGLYRLTDPATGLSPLWLIASGLLATIIGMAKGKFILTKTSNRNIERIQAMTEPQRPIHVYSKRSWIIISIMVLISLSLTIFQAPDLWRGVINIGIGLALITSSVRYLSVPNGSQSPA